MRYGDEHRALMGLPYVTRTLWVSAFQAYVFNFAASKRIEQSSDDVKVGDLLAVPRKCKTEQDLTKRSKLLVDEGGGGSAFSHSSRDLEKSSQNDDSHDQNRSFDVVEWDGATSPFEDRRLPTLADVVLPLPGVGTRLPGGGGK